MLHPLRYPPVARVETKVSPRLACKAPVLRGSRNSVVRSACKQERGRLGRGDRTVTRSSTTEERRGGRARPSSCRSLRGLVGRGISINLRVPVRSCVTMTDGSSLSSTFAETPNTFRPVERRTSPARALDTVRDDPAVARRSLLITPLPGVGPDAEGSVPRPPKISVVKSAPVLRTKKRSLPSAPSTSSDSMLTKLTLRPAPKTPSSVMTKSSPNSVPITMTVSKPSPPSMLTGALTAYWMRSAPAPPVMSVDARGVLLRADQREGADEECRRPRRR